MSMKEMKKILQTDAVTVRFRPDTPRYKENPNGEKVVLKRLVITELYQWAKYVSEVKIPEFVALSVGKPIDWVNDLEDEDFSELNMRSQSLNFTRAVILSDKDPILAAMIRPATTELYNQYQNAKSLGLISPELLKELQGSSSSEATSKGSVTDSPPNNS